MHASAYIDGRLVPTSNVGSKLLPRRSTQHPFSIQRWFHIIFQRLKFFPGVPVGISRSAENVPSVLGRGTALFVGLAAVWLCDCACLCACVRACLASERLRQRTSRRGASVIANTEYSARPRADGAWLSRCELRRRRQLRPCGRHLWRNTEEERWKRDVPQPTTLIFLFRFHSSSSADVDVLAFQYLLTRFRCSLFEFPTVRTLSLPSESYGCAVPILFYFSGLREDRKQ